MKNLNAQYLRKCDNSVLAEIIFKHYKGELSKDSQNAISKAIESMKPRVELVTDLYELAKMFIVGKPLTISEDAQQIIFECNKSLIKQVIERIQGIEEFDNSFIAYSLGNLCFDDVYSNATKDPIFTMSEFNKKAIIWEVVIENNNLISQRAIPVYLGDDQLEVGDVRILEELEEFSSALQKPKEAYISERKEFLSNFFKNRIKSNNLMWFITRLRIDTYKRYKKAKVNRKLYSKHITQQLRNRI